MKTALETMLSEYVDIVSRIGHPAVLERFVLKNGRAYEQAPIPSPFKRGTPRMCFMNATHAVLHHEMGVYTEGFAMTPRLGIPIHHAWLTIDGKAVDLTWPHDDATYFGVEFDKSVLIKETLNNGYYGLLTGAVTINVDFMREIDPEFSFPTLT